MFKLFTRLCLFVFAAAMIQSCVPPEEVVDTDLVKEASQLKTSEACQQAGGKWQRAGLAGNYMCVLYADDAGKECTDGSECVVACTLRNQDVKAGTEISGQCHESTDLFGCITYVNDGMAGSTFCVD